MAAGNPPDSGKRWRGPDGYWCMPLPDFEHDWAHAGPLLEELVAAKVVWFPNYKGDGYKVTLRDAEYWPLQGEGDTLTEAIANAWLAWKKEEAG